MYKIFAIFLVASLGSEAMTFRVRRQSGVGSTTVAPTAATARAQVQPVSPSVPAPDNGQNTLSQEELQECIRNCPVTSEYNPVCGSNNVTYSNPGRLLCTQACGVSVNLFRPAPCP